MSEKNKWALSPGALERPFGPIFAILTPFALWRHMEEPTYFFLLFAGVDDFT